MKNLLPGASGWVNDVDLVVCRNMLNTGGDVLTVYVEGPEPSTALDDLAIKSLTTPGSDGIFTRASIQVLTVLRISLSSHWVLIRCDGDTGAGHRSAGLRREDNRDVERRPLSRPPSR